MTLSLVLSVISLCVCVSGFFFMRWYIERKTAARELLADYRAEVYRLIAEIDAAADRDSLLVEERIKTLKKVLDDTDRRISVYMRELQRSRSGEAMYASLGRGIRAALDSHPGSTGTDHQLELIAPVEPAAPQESPTPPKPAASPKPRSSTPKNTTAGKRTKTKLRIQIAEMSAQGLSPAEIASRLKLSLAEVDLTLNLLKR